MKLLIASISVLLMVGCANTKSACSAYASDCCQKNEQIIASQKEMPKCDNKKCEHCYPKKYLNKD